ncbi:Abi-alpha family protein [Nocardioides sp. MAHUQ-72]|uniref:Abi-alpha family protein n=1 Tax=unclassified Nocardioides TaxID=2615069 RepID=UPI00361209DF
MSEPTTSGHDGVPEAELDPPVPPEPRGPQLPLGVADGFAPAVEALPGLARVAASAWWHTTEWGVRTSARAGRRVARAVTDADEAAALARDATEAASVIGGLARAVSSGVPLSRALMTAGESLGELAEPPEPTDGHAHEAPRSLRERGARLLERSRDVWSTDVGHPAYERILDELAPDEARILLLLLQGGPQPSVDVRTGGPIGMVNSQLIAPGLSMVGARAGCRYLDQVPAYLNNLFRLGLVWFSRESLRDPMEYQVVEAQPDVLAAVHSVKFAKIVRRSIHLTPFGEDFCRTCLVDESVAATDFPQHALPPEPEGGEPPSA